AVAWCLRQNYRGWLGTLLRHPLAAGALLGALLSLLLVPSYWAYSPARGLTAWDCVWSRAWAGLPVYFAQALLAGIVAELVRLGVPAWWPEQRSLVPPPYVAS